MKSSMSSFDIASIALELRPLLTGRRVDNIYQLDVGLFLFKFTPENMSLIIEPERRIHTTRYVTRTPEKPTQFAMELRKHLRGLVTTGLQQVGFERVIELTFGEQANLRKLIIELFPRGRLILTDALSRILSASSYARMRDRVILRGAQYVPAPSSAISPLSGSAPSDELTETLRDLQVVRALTKIYPVGGQYAEEALSRAGIVKDRATHSLSGEEWKRVADVIREMAVESIQHSRPTVYFDDSGNPFEITPIQLRTLSGSNVKQTDSLDQALDDYFTKLSQTGVVGKRLAKVENKRRELERILELQEERRTELIGGAARKRDAADAIVSHLGTIQLACEQAWSLRDAGEGKPRVLKVLRTTLEAAPSIRITDFDAKKSVLTVEAVGLPLLLGRRDKPQDLARSLYEQAKKSESKLKTLEEAINLSRNKLDAVESEMEIERASETTLKKKQEKAWFEKFRWFRSSEGFLVVAGRDASSNEALIKRHAGPNDLVFHADIQGAPFVVVKVEETSPTETTLKEAALAAVSYSRAWKAGFGSAEAYWIRADQLSKSPPPGEYLPKGAFVVRGQRNYLRGLETRVAVGVVVEDDKLIVMGGPPTAIHSRTTVSSILQPGNTPPMKIAMKLANDFNRTLQRRIGRKVGLKGEDLVPVLPPGKSEIAK